MHAGAKAVLAVKEPETSEEALKILDALGENWRGSDAEFDDYTFPGEPLGRLIHRAFGVRSLDEYQNSDEDGELWYEEVYRKFRERYDFC